MALVFSWGFKRLEVEADKLVISVACCLVALVIKNFAFRSFLFLFADDTLIVNGGVGLFL